jgi:hypothetical protein
MPAYSPLHDPILEILSAQVDDLEGLRIALNNRIHSLTNNEPDSDGLVRGAGLPEDDRDVMRLRAQSDQIQAVEAEAIRQLERRMRHSVWAPWLASAPGVGKKQLARLLGAISDPAWNSRDARFRTVDELYVYCGFHSVPANGHRSSNTHGSSTAGGPTVAPKHCKGVKSNWSDEARMRAWLIATSCVKQRHGTRYRDVYDTTRAKYADVVHAAPCAQCGPRGKPALPGSPLSKGHQHARALRAVAKAVLKDLWRESRRLHGFHPDEVVRRSA